MTAPIRKISYTIPCASAFREAVEALAARRGCNAGDLARSVVLMLRPDMLAHLPDPGGPPPGDRETVVRKSGPNKGEVWRRQPRLQVRMPSGLNPVTIRRALGFALTLAENRANLEVEINGEALLGGASASAARDRTAYLEDQVARLRTALAALSFTPLEEGVQDRRDALYVLGFAPGSWPSMAAIRARFRTLATVHHPDNPQGDHRRMSQLNEALAVLRGQV